MYQRTGKALNIWLPNDLHKELDDYWHEHRLPNRKDGIVELLRLGLRVAHETPPDKPKE